MAQFSTRGAVDLGALSTQRQNQQRAAAAMANAPDGVIIDVTEETFQSAVIDQSMRVPVVIDLWATWCQPCKQLSPILERLAAEAGGRWVLAKIDVDAQPRLGALFQAQSIPMVVAIIKGQPLPLFNGAYPEPQVRQVIDEVLRVAAEQGVDGTVAAPDSPVEEAADEVAEVVDPRLDEAFAAIEEGDWDGAERAYKALLDSAPGDPEALAGLATVGVYRRTDGAHDPASPQTVDELLLAADFAALRGDWPVAFGRGIDAVRQASGPERDRARTRVLEYFAMAGDDPAVASARTALASALF